MSDWEDNSEPRKDYGRGGNRRGNHGRGGTNRNNDFNSIPEDGEDWNTDNNVGGWGDDEQQGERSSRGGRGRGRGSRGGSRGGRFGNKNGGDVANGNGFGGDDQPPVSDKPRPTYIPPEIDDNDIKGVEVGTNFDQYENIKVKVLGDNVPQNIKSFKSSGLREILIEKATKCNYHVPTPIQKYSIPVIMNGRDLMASAQTGSGKTVSIIYLFLSDKNFYNFILLY